MSSKQAEGRKSFTYQAEGVYSMLQDDSRRSCQKKQLGSRQTEKCSVSTHHLMIHLPSGSAPTHLHTNCNVLYSMHIHYSSSNRHPQLT